MKKLLLLLVPVLLVSCSKDCPDQYGPDDCSLSWSSQIEGDYTGFDCLENQVRMNIEAIGPDELLLDGNFKAKISDPQNLDIPTQSFTTDGITVTVHGTGFYSNTTVNDGFSIYQVRTLLLQLTLTPGTGPGASCLIKLTN